MPASKARLGYGSKFYTGDTASPVSYTLLSEIATINFSDYSVAEVDVTHLLSPNSSEESIPGLLKPGTIELSGNYTGDASQQNIDVLAVAQTVFPWKITAPASGATVLTITGFGYIVKKETGPFEPSKKSDFKVGVRVSGAISYSVA
jgi:hypothetical protein